MGTYTELMEDRSREIDMDDDNYLDELLDVASRFRCFDEALDEFLQNHGYNGPLSDVEGKVSFLRQKLKQAGVPIPRGLRRWFTEHRRIERGTAFQLCIAFALDLAATEDFFRTVCLERCFDCHDMEEAVFYYAIRHGLTWAAAISILDRLPNEKKGRIDFEQEVLYTGSIIEEINRMQSEEELLRFFDENRQQFRYNNATAYRYIRDIWSRIAGAEGLAALEAGRLLGCKAPSSLWHIYLQILGVNLNQAGTLHTDRSLKPMLKDGRLLHPLAQDAFPDREGLSLILDGRHTSHERVRKLLILLVFYQFWATAALERNDAAFRAKGGEADTCRAEMDRYLLDAGHPALYAGNPYDWIFLYAAQDEFPLSAFRALFADMYLFWEENALGNPAAGTGVL